MVCSRSSLRPPPGPLPRCRPTASSSSMKMMHGAFALARSNRSRTRAAPTPTNISTNSDAATEKNGTPASPATALASSVFPVPGGPANRQPLGILAPSRVYLPGLCRKSTTSCSSSLAPSTPATSPKRTSVCGTSWNLERALAKSSIREARLAAPLPALLPRLMMKRKKRVSATNNTTSNTKSPMLKRLLFFGPSSTVMSTP
mmetsp:Transcript_68968/g.110460  ORF Transcript_68968/g.110460 Transcript_68968/m.110460 type:complete len:202 (+) Transcript_68968:1117-1722(+)